MSYKGTVNSTSLVTSDDTTINRFYLHALPSYQANWYFRATEDLDEGHVQLVGKRYKAGDIIVITSNMTRYNSNNVRVISSTFIINPNKRNGYPSIKDNEYDFGPVQITPYPSNMMYEDGILLNGYPRMINWKDPSPPQDNIYPSNMFNCDSHKMSGYPSYSFAGNFSPSQSRPYPTNVMSCIKTLTEGYPRFYTYGEFSPTMEEPHQREVMSCKDEFLEGYPTYRVARNFRDFGAFTKSDTTEIEIPYSVKYICDYAFYDTPITSVKINRHCIYFRHSFPPGCHIKPYKDE